jgi:type IV secretion system protein VirB4
MLALKKFRHTSDSFSLLLPYAALIDDGIILQKDGSFLAGWYFSGPDSQSSTPSEKAVLSNQLNAILLRFGTGWTLQVHAMRVPTKDYPDPSRSFFPDPVSKLIDEERRIHFQKESGHFESKYAITLMYRHPESIASRLTPYIFSGKEDDHEQIADKSLGYFKEKIREFEYSLNSLFLLRMMRSSEGFDEFLQFIRFCLLGQNIPCRLPNVPMYLDSLLTADFHHGYTPLIDNLHPKVISIDGYPSESSPQILGHLDKLPITYRWATRFVFMDGVEAEAHIGKIRKQWLQKVRPLLDQILKTNSGSLDKDAAQMVQETEDAIARVKSGLEGYGTYTSTLVLLGSDPKLLAEHSQEILQAIHREGFGARIEDMNASEAFLGSLPGIGYANIRSVIIGTQNLSDLLPLSSVWSGPEYCPCPFYQDESPPLMQVASGSTPFRLSLHVGDLGHTLIFGPTGSGKSTLLGLIAAQFRRYKEAQIFAFDKGNSMLPLTLALGGSHYTIGSGNELSFCPLSILNTDEDKAWALEWIETLVRLQGISITPDQRQAISTQIELRAASHQRSLSDFVRGVQDREIKSALEPYTISGLLGHLLDSKEDSLTLANFQTFEIEELMNMGERTLIPILLYIFRRIEKCLTGAPSLIILDEAWLMLGHEVFREKIREWLKVLRKANCAVVLATQSISDAEKSGIIDVLKESCPTKICLPNAVANQKGIKDFYERLGFNSTQIELVTHAQPKRDYYVATPEGRRLFHMVLGPKTLAFVGKSSKEDLFQVRILYEKHGKKWPQEWLEELGV